MKKFLFILFYISPVLAMEDEKLDINTAFVKALKYAIKNPSQEALNQIENCLNQGADINSKVGFHGETAIVWAVKRFSKSLFDFLLQKNADINACDNLERTPLYIALTNQKFAQFANFDIEKDFLKRGANPNTIKNGSTLLHSVINIRFNDLITLLIKYGAKINKKDSFKCTPLMLALDISNFEAVNKLCKLGASLIDIDSIKSNAFHLAIDKKLTKNYIKLLITSSRFDIYNKKVDEQLEKKVITAYLSLEKSNIFPKDIQKIIVSYLALDYFYGFNKKFCRQLVKNGNENPILTCTLNKVNCLEKILQSKNNQNKTALQVLYDEHQNNLLYIQEVESLVNVEKLRKDRDDFINGTTQEDNLERGFTNMLKKKLES